MKRSIVAVVAACMTLFVGTAFAEGKKDTGKAAAAPKVRIKVATILAGSDPATIQMEAFAKRVMEKSGGEIEVRVFPNSELGGNKDVLEAIVRGSNLITFVDPAALTDYVPDYSVMNGPYLYKDYTGIAKLAFSDWGKEMADQAAKKGIKVLDSMSTYFGTRQVITNKPIKTPEDMRNLKVRVPNTPMWLETIKAMGGSPTVIAWSELYSALQQGVADAAENPLPSIYNAKLQEVRKYVSETAHFIAPGGLEMSSQFFNGLSEKHQKILVEEGVEFAKLTTQSIASMESDIKAKMQAAGVTFNACDQEAFRKATTVVYSKFPQWTPGVYDRVKAILEK